MVTNNAPVAEESAGSSSPSGLATWSGNLGDEVPIPTLLGGVKFKCPALPSNVR